MRIKFNTAILAEDKGYDDRQSGLQTWLREEHNMYVIVLPTISMAWTFKIINIGNENIETPPYNNVDAYDYSTYEEALEEGLIKALNLI
jgi:hypothetical protein